MQHLPRRRLAILMQEENQNLATESNIPQVLAAVHTTPIQLSEVLCDSPSLLVAINSFSNGIT